MKPLYREASVERDAQGFAVALDGRRVRTPRGAALLLPTEALAEAVADEWRGQADTVRRETMPLARLADAALDDVAANPGAVVDAVVAWAETDLLCYRAARPPSLALRQEARWRPVLDWAEARFGAAFAVTTGVAPVRQDASALDAVRAAVEGMGAWPLAALREAAAATGSALLALALRERRIDAAEAVAASQLDERFQAERWGDDAEAAARLDALAAAVEASARFLRLLEA